MNVENPEGSTKTIGITNEFSSIAGHSILLYVSNNLLANKVKNFLKKDNTTYKSIQKQNTQ